MMGLRCFSALFSVGVVMLVPVRRASADAELILKSGPSTFNLPATSCGTGCEFATFDGSIGSWNINVDTGTGQVGGSPAMDLSFVDHFSGGAGATLTIEWSDTDFTSLASGLETNIGGTIGSKGSVSASLFGGNSDTLFDLNQQDGTAMNFSNPPVAFSGTQSSFLQTLPLTPYSLTEVIILSFENGIPGQSSGDYTVDSVPEPASAWLLGTVMVGLGLLHKFGK